MKKIIILFLILLCNIVFVVPSYGQPNIIINEFSQGSINTNEWIELVVTEDGTNIQGVYFTIPTDVNLINYSTKSVQLSKTNTDFASVSKGSIIVIYDGGILPKDPTLPVDDTDFSDGKIVIPHTNTTFLESGATFPNFRDVGDNVGLLTDGGVGIHALSYGTNARMVISSLFGPGSWGQAITLLSTNTAGQALYYTQQSSGQAGNVVNWAIRAFGSASPGVIDGTDDRLTVPTNKIIINEFSQGSLGTNEWIELVITEDGTNIQGVYFTVPPSPYTDYSTKSVQLKKIYPDFSSVSKGSIIVIYDGGVLPKDPTLPVDDTNFSDGRIVIPHTNTTFLESGAAFPNIRDLGDNIGLLTDGGAGIHAISYSGDRTRMTVSSLFGPGSWGQVIILNPVDDNQSAHYTEGTDVQAGNSVNWVDTTAAGATPGALNGGNNNSLPVELSSFSASVIGTGVKLSWRTETEVRNYGFEVERKVGSGQSSAGNYEKIGFVIGNGNSNSPKLYSFVDENVTGGKYSYRLKQIDTDGEFEYSKAIEIDLGSPGKFELSQNYPNPFNPVTTIKYTLPESGNIKLTLYNILGQEVKTLVNEFKESGVHTINFNASELNSGIYIYRIAIHSDKIEAGSFLQTRKMTLVK